MEFISNLFKGIKNGISNVFEGIGDLFDILKSIITLFVDLIKMVLNFLPSPFLEIGLSFVGIWSGILVYKLWKGN